MPTTNDLTKAQYNLVIEIMRLDSNLSLDMLLKQIAQLSNSSKKTSWLRDKRIKMMQEKIDSVSSIARPQKGTIVSKDLEQRAATIKQHLDGAGLLDIQRQIVSHLKFYGNVSVYDLDLSEVTKNYDDDSCSVIKDQIALISDLIKESTKIKPMSSDGSSLSRSCPFCKEPINKWDDKQVVHVFDTPESVKSNTPSLMAHLYCLVVLGKQILKE